MATTSVDLSAPSLQVPHGPALSTIQHRRRNLLGALAVAPVALSAAHTGTGELQDPHHTWMRELDLHRAKLADLPVDDDDRRTAHYAHESEIEGRIMTTPAATLAGVTIQIGLAASLIAHGISIYRDERDVICLRHAAVTLDRLAGRA